MTFRLFIFLLVCFYNILSHANSCLFQQGKSNYVIVVTEPNNIEKTKAAEFLQYYIEACSGTKIEIVNTKPTNSNYISISSSNTDNEGFTYNSDGNSLHIHGFGEKGIIYAVFDFLESEFGIHWYTSDYTYIPKLHSYTLKKFSITKHPAFSTRLNYYYDPLHDKEWCLHNKLNTAKYSRNDIINAATWWGMHTFKEFISEEKYFDLHPEYFCLLDGKRSKGGQPCLSNPKVLDIVVNSLEEVITKNPTYRIYDVSQNDNRKFCQCSKCTNIKKKYGGETGLNIWFVNNVAKRIKNSHPDKLIGTFAYRETRPLPTNIQPDDNVAIRLCSFETCLIHNFSDCTKNREFYNDLISWSNITKNLYIWDYCVGFKQYLAPCPNFRAIAERLRSYQQLHVKGILMLGSYDAAWGEFSELRQWVIAKLLWNPQQDVDSLAKSFIYDYYDCAAPQIYDFYTLTQKLVLPSSYFPIYADYKSRLYTSSYIDQASSIIEQALILADKKPAIKKRVTRIAAQIYYLKSTKYPYKNEGNTSPRQQLRNIVESDPTYLMEHRKDINETYKILGFTK